MEIRISDSVPIFEIQKAFSKKFPYLKLEFLVNNPKGFKDASKENPIADVSKTIGEIRHIHYIGPIKISGNEKVRTFEEMLRDLYGLSVRIYRKTGNVWLRTNITDGMTLSEQNNLASDIAFRTKVKTK